MDFSKISNNGFMKLEALLRFLAFCMLLLAALLMATDTQTKVFFQILTKTVTFKVTKIFIWSVYVYSIGAGYSLAQLARCLAFKKDDGDKLTRSTLILNWISLLLDQLVVYVLFAISCASAEFSIRAIFGAEDLQWMKLCNKYTRLCVQFAVSIVFGFIGFIILGVVSSISAFNLFRWYSPANFLRLKARRMRNVVAASTS